MSTRSRLLVAGTVGLLLAALPALAKMPPKTKPKSAPAETAVIENSGSTNTLGYVITISSNYYARIDEQPRVPVLSRVPKALTDKRGGGQHPVVVDVVLSRVPKALTDRFFADLNAAMPLTALPVRHGMRSASFGTQTFITYKGQKSPDLTFASDPRTVALKADIDSITKDLGFVNAPRRPVVIHADHPIVIHADR